MKLIHLSDLHLGKRLCECSLLEDQRYILEQILEISGRERPDAVLIAGDVYDKPVPSAEAVALLDWFLVELSGLGAQICIISGNHDSPERLSFGARLMDQSGVRLAPVYDGQVKPVSLADSHGTVDIWLLPFVKPAHVRRFFPEAEISSYTQALSAAIGAMELDPGARNVLVTHQFVTGASRSESEDISVGGADNVDASVFALFDYVALGHLHSPQWVERETVRYCGSPLKYSFSEVRQRKSVTVVELGEKGDTAVRTVPLAPLRDMVELRGSYDQLTLRAFYEGKSWREDYVRITLTDEEDVPDGYAKLRTVYRNLMRIDYDNMRARAGDKVALCDVETDRRTPLELLEVFYEMQNGQAMGADARAFAQKIVEDVWEGEA